MAELDIVIRGGQITTADSVAVADVGILGETIVQIGGEMRGSRELDARGRAAASRRY